LSYGSGSASATRERARSNLARLAAGNTGDIKTVGGGVSELRTHFGPGYRVYVAQQGSSWILLLCGGDKSSQQKDIETAKRYLHIPAQREHPIRSNVNTQSGRT